VTAIIAQTEGGQVKFDGHDPGHRRRVGRRVATDAISIHYRTAGRIHQSDALRGACPHCGELFDPGFYGAMRQAAAATREMLVAAAAKQLGVSPDDLSVSESKVTHSRGGRYLTFGQLAAAAAKEPVPAKPGCALETSFI